MYVAADYSITWPCPICEGAGRRVEADDLTENGRAYRILGARWYRWLHQRVGVENAERWAVIRAWALAEYGAERLAKAETMELPAGYCGPRVVC